MQLSEHTESDHVLLDIEKHSSEMHMLNALVSNSEIENTYYNILKILENIIINRFN